MVLDSAKILSNLVKAIACTLSGFTLYRISSSIIARMLNIYHWLDITYRFSPEGRRYYKKVELIKEYTQKVSTVL